MDWIHLGQDKIQCRAFVSMVMNLLVLQNTGYFFTIYLSFFFKGRLSSVKLASHHHHQPQGVGSYDCSFSGKTVFPSSPWSTHVSLSCRFISHPSQYSVVIHSYTMQTPVLLRSSIFPVKLIVLYFSPYVYSFFTRSLRVCMYVCPAVGLKISFQRI